MLLLLTAGCTGLYPIQAPDSAPPAVGDDPPGDTLPDGVPPEEQIAALIPQRSGRIAAKKAENESAVGWLVVPGTTIDTVIVKNPPGDNDYYTTHDFYGNPDLNGAYGADFRCDFSSGAQGDLSRCTVLYAHNHDEDPDGILFAQLKKFKDPAFARAHPYLYFSTETEDMAWEIFAVFDATVNVPYNRPDVHWGIYSEVLELAYDASIYDYGIRVTGEDKLLVLSTCTFVVPGRDPLPIDIPNEYRFVVMARLVEPKEEAKTQARFTLNADPLPPDSMPVEYVDNFVFGGEECLPYFTGWNSPYILLPEQSRLELAGKIRRSGIREAPGDWDAAFLPAGTAVYRDPEHPDMLLVELDGRLIPYRISREAYEEVSVTLLLEEDGAVIAEKTFSAQEDLSFLTPYVDPLYTVQRADSTEDIREISGQRSIHVYFRRSDATYVQTFFVGTPASVGRDGYFYTDTTKFEELSEMIRT